MDQFKAELRVLLSRYPQVKNVRYTVEEVVDVSTNITPLQQMPIPPITSSAAADALAPKTQTPFERAKDQAEITVAAIASRTTGKMTVTESSS